MILTDWSSTATIFLPKTKEFGFKKYKIVLRSELTNKEHIYNNVKDLADYLEYYIFIIDLTYMPDNAEYVITLYGIDEKEKEEEITTTLLRMGNYQPTINNYNNEVKYTEYNAE